MYNEREIKLFIDEQLIKYGLIDKQIADSSEFDVYDERLSELVVKEPVIL